MNKLLKMVVVGLALMVVSYSYADPATVSMQNSWWGCKKTGQRAFYITVDVHWINKTTGIEDTAVQPTQLYSGSTALLKPQGNYLVLNLANFPKAPSSPDDLPRLALSSVQSQDICPAVPTTADTTASIEAKLPVSETNSYIYLTRCTGNSPNALSNNVFLDKTVSDPGSFDPTSIDGNVSFNCVTSHTN